MYFALTENMPSDNENEEEVWDPSDTSDTDCCEFESNDGPLLPTKRTNASPDQQKVAIVQWILIFLLRLQTKHYIPDSAINALLVFGRSVYDLGYLLLLSYIIHS